jgi:SAM-dependent methyltransferase
MSKRAGASPRKAGAVDGRRRDQGATAGDLGPRGLLLHLAPAPPGRGCAVRRLRRLGRPGGARRRCDGNFAPACAREGARVVASDISPAMVERGRARSEAEGYPIESVEPDAEELPFEDGSSTAWAPVFGAMLAPRPDVAARELFRVVRHGGTVGMTAFTPGSFADEQFEIGRRYGPSQPSQPRAVEWGIEETVRSRFKGLAPGWSSRSGLSRSRRRHRSSSSPSRRPRPGAGRPPAGRSRVSDSTPCGVAEATVRCESTTSTS